MHALPAGGFAPAPGPAWDEDDLEARLLRALGVADRVIATFAVDGYADPERPGDSFHGEKPIAETAMLLLVAQGAAHRPKIGARIGEIARRLAPHARSGRALVDMALHPALAFKFAVPHVILTRLGLPDPGFDRLLRLCANASARNGVDRSPAAETERRWIEAAWDPGRARPPAPADLAGSLLASPLDLFGGLRADAYAFTHLLMYAADFGHRPAPLPCPQRAVLETAGALLARYIDERDYDLAGELLLTWPFLGARWSAEAAFAFRVLAGLEDAAGILPCGATDGDRLARLEEPDRARYALATAYHTAYVMGFLCAAALRPGLAPPLRLSGDMPGGALLARIEPYLETGGHWQPAFAGLDAPERQALAPFLLDLALVRSARLRDYAAMQALLGIAVDAGLTPRPLVGQAAELLTRIAACGDAIAALRASGRPVSGEVA